MNVIAEALDHQETGKNGEDLAPGAGHEGEGVVEPVALSQDQLLVLGTPSRKCG